jgi:hypothetical protein
VTSIDELKAMFRNEISDAIGTLNDIESRILGSIDLLDKSIEEHDCYG